MNEQVGMLKKVYKSAISAPKLASVLHILLRIGLVGYIIGIDHSAVIHLLELHCVDKALNHHFISKLMSWSLMI